MPRWGNSRDDHAEHSEAAQEFDATPYSGGYNMTLNYGEIRKYSPEHGYTSGGGGSPYGHGDESRVKPAAYGGGYGGRRNEEEAAKPRYEQEEGYGEGGGYGGRKPTYGTTEEQEEDYGGGRPTYGRSEDQEVRHNYGSTEEPEPEYEATYGRSEESEGYNERRRPAYGRSEEQDDGERRYNNGRSEASEAYQGGGYNHGRSDETGGRRTNYGGDEGEYGRSGSYGEAEGGSGREERQHRRRDDDEESESYERRGW